MAANDADATVAASTTLSQRWQRALAQSITDAPLRTTTLQRLALEWAKVDAVAAGQYVASSPLFVGPERENFLAQIRTDHRG